MGSVVVAHGLSCSVTGGIFPGQRSSRSPVHWQAGSWLCHRERPWRYLWYGRSIFEHFCSCICLVLLLVKLPSQWAAPPRLASLAVAQLWDWRKSPETATETSLVYWIGDLSCLEQGSGVTTCRGLQRAGRIWQQSLLLVVELGDCFPLTLAQGKQQGVMSLLVAWAEVFPLIN